VLGATPHASIGKALSILGLGRDSLETVATLPGRTAIDPAALETRLRALDGAPAIVVASAGEVNTGDFDDLAAVAALARRHGAWLHVDGAFGLFAALVPAHAEKLAGVAHADSVTVDLHKWLNVPYDAAVAYTRLPGATRAVFRSSAAYLADAPDPLHLVPENSRRFRALPAWTSIAAYGRAGIAAIVARNCEQARRFAEGLASIPAFELLDEVRLNIACFALRDGGADARDRVLERLARGGRAFMTPTTLFGRPGIRAAFSNWSTRDEDVAIALDALRAAL
jgi:glutamate/tyrosine decarboxylase-like PLP-dependent enzyme